MKVVYKNLTSKWVKKFKEVENDDDIIELYCDNLNLQDLPRPSLTHFIRYELNQRLSYNAL
jgi:hypothetical protein